MKVSVLVAAHNYARFLPAALDSVLSQDYRGDLECVVVDDGSTDDTAGVLEAYRGKVVGIGQANAGQAAALNTAYGAASGEVLCLLDADDAWEPSKVAEVVAAFEHAPPVGLVHHPLRIVDEGGGRAPGWVGRTAAADGDVAALMRRTTLRWLFAPTSGLALRRTVARHVFPLRTGLKCSADELIAPVAALLAPVRYLPDALGTYRIHGSNVWASQFSGEVGGGEQDGRRERWYRRLLEEKVAHANDVLRRSGVGGRLSPWLKWDYVKAVGACDGRPALGYLPRVLVEAARVRGVPLADRLRLLGGIARKTLRQARRASGTENAADGVR